MLYFQPLIGEVEFVRRETLETPPRSCIFLGRGATDDCDTSTWHISTQPPQCPAPDDTATRYLHTTRCISQHTLALTGPGGHSRSDHAPHPPIAPSRPRALLRLRRRPIHIPCRRRLDTCGRDHGQMGGEWDCAEYWPAVELYAHADGWGEYGY